MKIKLALFITFSILLSLCTQAQVIKNIKLFGNKIGTWHLSDTSGTVSETMHYNLKGELNGEYIRYYKDGGIAVIGAYKKNKQDGEWQAFDKKQKLSEIISLDLAKKVISVEWIFILQADSLSVNEHTGLRRYYHSNGNILATGKYKKAKRIGLWQLFYANGNTYCIGRYKNNMRVGKWQFYYENGNLKQCINYLKDAEVESKEFFDREGEKSQIVSQNRHGELKETTYLTQKAKQKAEESEFRDLYIKNMDGDRISEYSVGDSIYIEIVTKNMIGESMDLQFNDDDDDLVSFKISDVYVYNVSLENIILKNDIEKIFVEPFELSSMECLRNCINCD